MTNNQVLNLEVGIGVRVSISVEPSCSHHSVGRWCDSVVTLHRSGQPDLVLQQDCLNESIIRIREVLRVFGATESAQRMSRNNCTPVGYDYNLYSYKATIGSLEDVVSEIESGIIWATPSVVSCLYRQGDHLLFEVSPFCTAIYEDLTESERATTVAHFLSTFQPHLKASVSDSLILTWSRSVGLLAESLGMD